MLGKALKLQALMMALVAASCTVTPSSAAKPAASCAPYSFHTFSSETITNLLALIELSPTTSAGISARSPRPTKIFESRMIGIVRRGAGAQSTMLEVGRSTKRLQEQHEASTAGDELQIGSCGLEITKTARGPV